MMKKYVLWPKNIYFNKILTVRLQSSNLPAHYIIRMESGKLLEIIATVSAILFAMVSAVTLSNVFRDLSRNEVTRQVDPSQNMLSANQYFEQH